jgi:uroporphyrinogen decarboxylase
MTSRERVIKAINFEEPDRVPVDWGMITLSGIHEAAYRNLLEYLNMPEAEVTITDPVQRLTLLDETILDMFNVDTRVIWANPPSHWNYQEDEAGNFHDEFGVFFKRCGYYCDFTEYPLARAESIEDLKRFTMPDPTDKARFAGLRDKAKTLYETTDKALVAGTFPALYYIAWALRGYEAFMTDVALNPTFANYLLDMIVDWFMALMDGYLREIGDYIQIMWAGDDWGTQDGPLISPREFRKNVVPRFKKIIAFMKARSRAKLAYHSCGSVLWALDDFIEMGVDILHPVQANAAHMGDSRKVKNLCYGKLTIHGGLDNQGKFHLTRDIVVDDARQKIQAFAPGGGYLFSSGHNIQANCPPENIAALFETAKQWGRYPIQAG